MHPSKKILCDIITVIYSETIYYKEKRRIWLMEMIIDEKLREVAASDDEKYIQIYTKLCSSWAGSFIEVLARFVSREEADKFTTLLPINMALSICVFSSISLSTREAFLFLSSANDLIRILFTVVKQVSADEKKAESASRISKITICRASLESKKNQLQS